MAAPFHHTASRSPYGPVIIVLAAVVMLATLPGRTHGLGLITESLLKDLKVDRVEFATINLWATLIGSAFCLPIGWTMDRFGLRWVTAAMLVATGFSAWELCRQTGAFLPLLMIVTLTRGFGQSALSVCSITSVGKWYPGKAGWAMGWYSFLCCFLFAAAFGVVGAVVSKQGWRVAWTAISFTLVLVLAPLVLLLLRDPPQHLAAAGAESGTLEGMTLADALRTPAFWIFAGATALFGLVSSGLGLFQQAVLAERGFDEKAYHALLVVTTLISLAAQFVCGWSLTRYPIGRVTGVALLVYAASLGLLPFVKNAGELWTFATLAGFSGGMIIVVFFAIWGQAFGRRHLGRIQATAQMLTVFMSAIGPLLFAKCQAALGSYSPLLLTVCPIVLFFAIAAWWVILPSAQPASPLPSPELAGAN
ncbi:MAG TPA: MFS transporter [Verrucomicrobiae bacterium]|nr:MFS transporter [Verrucomicrobiae bacterium]